LLLAVLSGRARGRSGRSGARLLEGPLQPAMRQHWTNSAEKRGTSADQDRPPQAQGQHVPSRLKNGATGIHGHLGKSRSRPVDLRGNTRKLRVFHRSRENAGTGSPGVRDRWGKSLITVRPRKGAKYIKSPRWMERVHISCIRTQLKAFQLCTITGEKQQTQKEKGKRKKS